MRAFGEYVILYCSTSSINVAMNLHEFNIPFSTYTQIMSLESVISFLINDFIYHSYTVFYVIKILLILTKTIQTHS